MTQKDKLLLLKDLSARLPYGVIVRGVFLNYNKDKDKILYEECDEELNYENLKRYESLRPYLRPMSSMTEEEENEYINIDNRSYSCPMNYAHIPASDRINWLNAHHFDYNGLIPKGLAIEVKEGIYEY